MFADRLFHLWKRINAVAVLMATIIIGLVALAGMAALAQTVLAAPATPDAPLDIASIVASVQSGNGWMIAGVVVSLLTWGLRKGILNKLPWPLVVTWLHDYPAVAMGTPFVLASLGGVLATFASGTPFTWALFLSTVVKVSVTAIGAFVGAKTVQESANMGKEAAAAVDTKAKATEEIKP